MPPAIVHSRRLYLRQATPEDVEVFFAMDRDPEVMRFIADGATTTDMEVTRAGLGRVIAAYARRPGLGLWVCCLLDGTAVGWFALKPCQLSFPAPDPAASAPPPPPAEHIEVGYRLLRGHWGQGYATEMASELLHHGFHGLGIGRIIAACKPQNLASSRVLIKAGSRMRGAVITTPLWSMYMPRRKAAGAAWSVAAPLA